MVTRETVLVIGAGASFPYGLPLGKELVERVIQIISTPYLAAHLQLLRIGKKFGIPELTSEAILEFSASLNKSHLFSIDAFLEGQSEIFQKIGKIVITQALISYENENLVTKRLNELRASPLYLSEVRYERRWYDYLINKLHTVWDNYSENKLKIITFNYDRSLELFLWNALKGAYPGKSKKEYLSKYSTIKIIHMHGKFGNLPWEEGLQHGYGAVEKYMEDSFDEKMYQLSNQIRIIHDEVEKSNECFQANQAIDACKALYFLGFGYHELNLRRLASGIRTARAEIIQGSSFNLDDAEKSDIGKLFLNVTDRNIQLGQASDDVLGFMRSSVEWISSPKRS